MTPRPNLTPEEIRDSGLLQEVNRRLLHPRGLAMFVVLPDSDDEEITSTLGIMVDDDVEGWTFGGPEWEADAATKARRFDELLMPEREGALGFVEQPLPEPGS